MAERRSIWPLLAYVVVATIVAARRAKTEETPASGKREIGREPHRVIYPAPNESSEIPDESGAPTQVDPDKRPKEQVENDQPISAQLRRANEHGRGRHAVVPWEIPWAGWKDIFWRVYASVNDNRLLAVAAGVVFYSLLAIFPAIAAFASLYGLIADASTIDSHLSLAAGIFPFGAVDILHEQIARLTAKGDAKLSLGSITGLTVALWSANAGMKGIIDALKVVNDEKEKRSFVKLNLLSHAWTPTRLAALSELGLVGRAAGSVSFDRQPGAGERDSSACARRFQARGPASRRAEPNRWRQRNALSLAGCERHHSNAPTSRLMPHTSICAPPKIGHVDSPPRQIRKETPCRANAPT